jgi:transposase
MSQIEFSINQRSTKARLPMQRQPTYTDFSGQTLFVGLDVHKASWRVSIHTEQMEYKTFTQPPHADALLGYLRRTFPGATVRCAYEAGFSGFSAAHSLRAAGIDCLVVHPPDIPTTEYDRRHKNDRNDARRLGRELRSGQIHSVYVPTMEAIEARALVRMRGVFIKKQTRCKTQIRMALMFLGVEIPASVPDAYWSRVFIAWLEQHTLTTTHGTAVLKALLDELLFLREKILEITRRIRAMAQSATYQRTVRILVTVPGIGVLTAMTLITELVDITRFRSADALASYVGLIPGEASSGEKIRTTGVTSRRNAALRHVLIESAWASIRNDPALLQVFEQATRRMVKSKAIVIVARRLVNRLRKVWLTGTAYQKGISGGTVSASESASES